MTGKYTTILVFFLLLFFTACKKKSDVNTRLRLMQWSQILDSVPQQVSDSLKKLNLYGLSRENRTYYNLLNVISDDKTYVNFTSDSLINSVVDYYKKHDPRSDDYIRALVYQGIVRTRMGVNDSTVFEPLKQSEDIYHHPSDRDPSLGYMIHFFLGNTHYNNGNYALAKGYFNDALNYAAQEKSNIHIFDANLALFWNEMNQRDFEKAKAYLDVVSSFYNKLPEKVFSILSAQSIFYDTQGEYNRALDCEKTKLLLTASQKEDIDMSRVYFNVSSRYSRLNKLDSAMYYAQLSVQRIKDPDYRYNYLLFDNIANIAEKQQNYMEANEYRKNSLDFYQKSVKERLNTQVMELEKKYDLSEAENVILRSQQSILVITLITLMLGTFLIAVIMINRRNRKKTTLQLMNAEHEAQKQALKAELLTEEANKRAWLMQLYGYISDRLTLLQDRFEDLSQRYVSSHPKIYNSMNNILREASIELRDIPKDLTPNAETFYYYTNLEDDENFFNANEKLFLMLLACKATNRQIATFMGTTMESIRSRKSQLKKKMTEKGFDTAAFF